MIDEIFRGGFQKKQQPPSVDTIKQLAPDAPAEVQALLRRLKSREEEIGRWFQEDPKRIESLREDPETTFENLLTAMELERPAGMNFVKLRDWELVFEPPILRVVGNTLLVAVWQFVVQGPNNLAQFKNDPFKVVNDVADATNASQAERDAVMVAIEAVTGRRYIGFNPMTMIHEVLGVAIEHQPVTARRRAL